MSLASKYKKSLEAQWCLRFRTRHPDCDSYDGVVTQIRKGFIVLREEVGFVVDGVIVFPKKSIIGCRDGKVESCCNDILRENGAIKKCRSPRWLNSCETLPGVLAEMKKRDVWPGVEILFNEGKESAFYIGPILEISSDHFYIRCYDSAGKWEKEYKVTYEEIFKVEFDSRYVTNFNRYMRRRAGT